MANIYYQTGIPALHPKWSKALSDALNAIGIEAVTISSSYRNPLQQAKAMVTNINAKGAESQKAYYSATYDKIVDVYVNSMKQGAKLNDTLNLMAQHIERIPFKSGHTNPDIISQATFDIPPRYIPDDRRTAFVKKMKAIASKFIDPAKTPGEPVYHIELGGVKAQTVAGAGLGAAALVAAVVILLMRK